MKGINFEFKSVFAPKLNAFIDEMQALGYSYVSSARRLRYFDNTMYVNHIESDELTEKTVLLWTEPKIGEAASNQLCRVSTIRAFAAFLMQSGEDAYLCPYPHNKRFHVYQPYIFTKDEIVRIFKAADSIRPDWRSPRLHLTIPVIIKTLYGTGMRISEVMKLKLRDVDLTQNCIMVRETKGGKERLLPISNSLAQIYENYYSTAKFSNDDYLFTKKHGAVMNHSAFYYSFRNVLDKADIPHLGRGSGPRIHDLRHSMAVHRLNQWAVEKKDITAMLPILAVYLGHENVRIVLYYLRLTAQVYPEVTAQVERDFGEVIPDILSKEWEALNEND